MAHHAVTHAAVRAEAPPEESGRVCRVIAASSLGAVFEADDLVLFGPMAAIIARQFFSGLDEAYAYVFPPPVGGGHFPGPPVRRPGSCGWSMRAPSKSRATTATACT